MSPAARARLTLDAVVSAQDGTLLEYWNSIKDEERERVPNFMVVGNEGGGQ